MAIGSGDVQVQRDFVLGYSNYQSSIQSKAARTVKIGVLPIEDNIPFLVAQKDGLFRQAGVNVELIDFASPAEMDNALQAGQVDGGIVDLVSAALLNKGGTDVKVCSVGMRVNQQEARFAVLSSPISEIRNAEQLKNAGLAVIVDSIIEFAVDKMLQDKGVEPIEVRKVPIAEARLVLDMLLSNKIDAACLPFPLANLAQTQGAHLIVDDAGLNVSRLVLVIRSQSFGENQRAIWSAICAYEDAGQAVTESPGKYRSFCMQKTQIADSIQETYRTPVFTKLTLPSQDEVKTVVEWMVNKNLLPTAYTYYDLVDENFLPIRMER